LQRVGFRNALERVHDVGALVLLAVFLSPMVSATIGVASLYLGGALQGAEWSHLWFVWWAGDAGGALLVTPALLTWHEAWRRGANWRRLRQALPAATALLAVCVLVFRLELSPAVRSYPLEYAVLPVLFWIALRFGQVGSATALLTVAVSAIWGTLKGVGPFTPVSWEESVWMQQGFLGVVGITVMVVTAVIGERRSAETEIRASEERFRTIFENAPVMIDSFDEAGNCLLWNRECETRLGWSREEIAASPDPLSLVYSDRALRDVVLADINRADGSFREYPVLAKDGSTRVQQWANFRLPQGTLISLGYDVTERVRAEAEIRALNEHLEKRVRERTALLEAAIERRELAEEQARRHQADLAHVLRVQTMGEMAAGLAHEINQPLGAIANYAQGCRRRIASGSLTEAELMEMLNSIAAEALRAGQTIRHLRSLVRKQESQREATDVNRIVHDALELTEPDTRASGVTVRLALADDLPPVLVDRVQIEQVVLNLLRNAVEAMHDCRGDALLIVETRTDGAGSVEVAVATRVSACRRTEARSCSSRSSPTRRPASAWGSPSAARSSSCTADASGPSPTVRAARRFASRCRASRPIRRIRPRRRRYVTDPGRVGLQRGPRGMSELRSASGGVRRSVWRSAGLQTRRPEAPNRRDCCAWRTLTKSSRRRGSRG
jgi:PAS domain S-box-containing protein